LGYKFPNLTYTEKKMCALLKLNLSNKEIAALTSHNYMPVKKNKPRLRKKLGLSTETDIYDFMAEI